MTRHNRSMTNERIPLLIDTDPGVDDALALLMAFNDARHEVVGLTIAAGNVGLEHTVANALKLCEVCGVDVPVFPGTAEPLLHPAEDAAFVHGRDGFGDTGYAKASRQAESEHAALAILRLSHQYAGKLLLVALGPLTNVALALKLDPTLPSRVARCLVMGGAVSARGNISAAAEFNIAFDPEAAHIVFSAFPKIDVADWEAVIAHGFLHEGGVLCRDLGAHPQVVARRARRTLARRRRAGDGLRAGAGRGERGAGAAAGGGTGWPPYPRQHRGRLEPPAWAPGQCRDPDPHPP